MNGLVVMTESGGDGSTKDCCLSAAAPVRNWGTKDQQSCRARRQARRTAARRVEAARQCDLALIDASIDVSCADFCDIIKRVVQ